jgi:hypothetical protein
MPADLLTRVRVEIEARLAELRPALAEHQRLLDAADALEADAAMEHERPAAQPVSARAAQPARPAPARVPARAARAPRARSAPIPRRAPRGSAAGAIGLAVSAPASPAEEAIVAALEHGSHTLGELVLVSAISAREIREGLRRLQRAGTITRARREGRAAYALASTTAD